MLVWGSILTQADMNQTEISYAFVVKKLQIAVLLTIAFAFASPNRHMKRTLHAAT